MQVLKKIDFVKVKKICYTQGLSNFEYVIEKFSKHEYLSSNYYSKNV